MKLLKEIIRNENIDFLGRQLFREAVRGIIVKDRKILMIYSTKQKDYKFPGGGVDPGETYKEALIREIREECGAKVLSINAEFGKTIEYGIAIEEEYDIFKMVSYYYVCEVDSVFGKQSLEQYEKDLGFEPVWTDVNIAIRANKDLIEGVDTPRWTPREAYVLDLVKEKFDL